MHKSTFIGLIIGIGGILLGQVLEGGHVSSIIQGTAAIIVFAGTLGAVMVSTPGPILKDSVRLLRRAFFKEEDVRGPIIKQIVEAAQLARKESILSLEKEIPKFRDPFQKNVFRYVVDGVEAGTLRDIFETEISVVEERELAAAKVFMDAGGFAPTVGIIGAVLGLIHVMENLTDTSKLGSGIAVAFVATVYGVGSANLVFIPLANKIKALVKERAATKEMILAGGLSLMAGMNPHLIEEKLRSYKGEGTQGGS